MSVKNLATVHFGIVVGMSAKPLWISSTIKGLCRYLSPFQCFNGTHLTNTILARSYCTSGGGADKNSNLTTGASPTETGVGQGAKLSSSSSSTSTISAASISTSSSNSKSKEAYQSVSLLTHTVPVSTLGEESNVEMKKTYVVGSVDSFFNFSKSFKRSDIWKSKIVNSMLVYPNFISIDEEVSIMMEIEPYISRLHYESSHWDDAIHQYRETERSKWSKKNEIIINRIRELAFPPDVPQLKLVHILDLAKEGIIKPHIDSIRFCGNTIGGLSLLSDCVMRLRHDVQKDFHCDIYLPRFSLYVMQNFARYEFAHEILGEADSKFQDLEVKRDRRISIICRNEPENTTAGLTEPVFTPIKM